MLSSSSKIPDSGQTLAILQGWTPTPLSSLGSLILSLASEPQVTSPYETRQCCFVDQDPVIFLSCPTVEFHLQAGHCKFPEIGVLGPDVRLCQNTLHNGCKRLTNTHWTSLLKS